MRFQALATTVTVAALALLSATSVFASEGSDDALKGYVPSKTRAQVLAELQQAKADGSIRAAELNYREPVRSVAARAQVKAETRLAIASGEAAWLNSEHSSYVLPKSATTAAGN